MTLLLLTGEKLYTDSNHPQKTLQMLAVAIPEVVGLGIIFIFASLYFLFSCLIINIILFCQTRQIYHLAGIEVPLST